MSDDRSRFAGEVVDQLPSADILNLHWVTEFVDIPEFFERTNVPIVWTLHDMNPITGGCHYSFGCRRFEKSCGRCPLIDSTVRNDPSRRSWNRKRAVFEKKIDKRKLHIVAPSKWLAREAERSTLLGEAPIHRIPNGLDHTLFHPGCAEAKRSELNIPSARKVILFVAHSSTDYRKGIDLLVEALAKADLENVTLISIGSDSPAIPDRISHVHVGHVNDDERLSALYSMADVFVIPSRQDNLPNTVPESMACGTPVVGFETGGIPDMVRPGETGWLAETGSVRELRRAIETALENDAKREQMAGRCRQVVENEYTMEHQAQQYTALYTSILEDSRR
jgi:glycosyltransferase involved in cell wall biosynthesis